MYYFFYLFTQNKFKSLHHKFKTNIQVHTFCIQDPITRKSGEKIWHFKLVVPTSIAAI